MKRKFIISICLLLFLVSISNISAADVDNVTADDAVLMENVDLTDNASDAIIADVDDEANNVNKASKISLQSGKPDKSVSKNTTVNEPLFTRDDLRRVKHYQTLADYYGWNSLEDIASKMKMPQDEILKMLGDLRSGCMGEKYQLLIQEKDEENQQKIDSLNAYIGTDFNTTEESYKNMHIEDYTPHGITPELVEYVGDSYGTASVSLMAFRVAVSCGEVIDTINEIKDGKHGSDLQKKLFDMDTKNQNEIDKLNSYIIRT